MANHPHRKSFLSPSYVILLPDGRLWQERGASGPSIFSSLAGAQKMLANTRISALKEGCVMEVVAPWKRGSHFNSAGYWIAPPAVA